MNAWLDSSARHGQIAPLAQATLTRTHQPKHDHLAHTCQHAQRPSLLRKCDSLKRRSPVFEHGCHCMRLVNMIGSERWPPLGTSGILGRRACKHRPTTRCQPNIRHATPSHCHGLSHWSQNMCMADPPHMRECRPEHMTKPLTTPTHLRISCAPRGLTEQT